MSRQKKEAEVLTPESYLVQLAADEPIRVTPNNPLAVTGTPVTYNHAVIAGGDITVAIGADVTFSTLTKES
jgi:hypothetical protein